MPSCGGMQCSQRLRLQWPCLAVGRETYLFKQFPPWRFCTFRTPHRPCRGASFALNRQQGIWTNDKASCRRECPKVTRSRRSHAHRSVYPSRVRSCCSSCAVANITHIMNHSETCYPKWEIPGRKMTVLSIVEMNAWTK